MSLKNTLKQNLKIGLNPEKKFKKKKIKDPISIRLIFEYVLLFCGFVCLLWSISYTLNHINDPKMINVVLALPFIAFLTPYLLLRLYGVKIIETKMGIIPRFLRDIVDNVDSGMDLVSSIKVTTTNEYGALNEDIRKLSNHLSWGIDFDIALLEFAKNVGSTDLKRDFLLVIEARKIGGHAEKILRELSYKISTEILRKKERKSNLSSNTFTGYISFMIFLFIIVLIYNSLFLSLGSSTNPQTTIDASEYETQDQALLEEEQQITGTTDTKTLMYLTLLILLSYELAILSGFLFGLMQENNVISGAPHVAALVFLTFIGFYFFIHY